MMYPSKKTSEKEPAPRAEHLIWFFGWFFVPTPEPSYHPRTRTLVSPSYHPRTLRVAAVADGRRRPAVVAPLLLVGLLLVGTLVLVVVVVVAPAALDGTRVAVEVAVHLLVALQLRVQALQHHLGVPGRHRGARAPAPVEGRATRTAHGDLATQVLDLLLDTAGTRGAAAGGAAHGVTALHDTGHGLAVEAGRQVYGKREQRGGGSLG